jgi:lipopolysaccharide transport system ATP-binding protein
MTPPVIRVEGLGKRYRLGQNVAPYLTLRDAIARLGSGLRGGKALAQRGEFWALRDVGFEIARGDTVALVGRNGAGKSTLLKILSRITAPTTGKAELFGRVGSLLEVGTGFHPELTGRENIYLNGAILGMRQREIARSFDQIVAFAGVEKFVDTAVKRYSSGMHTRLAFAVAAHLETEILLVDEVLAVGDAEFQRKCLGKMQDVAHEGRTVIFVSHNMSAVAQLCRSAVALKNGEVWMTGGVHEVIKKYLAEVSASTPAAIQDQLAVLRPDPALRVLDIRVVQPGNDTGGDFFTHLPFDVEMTYELTVAERNLRVGFDLIANDGALLFRAFDDDMRRQERRLGVFTSRCRVPGNLLMPGDYVVSPSIGIDPDRWIVHKDVSIGVQFMQIDGVNMTYMDTYRRPGYLMPELDWSVGPQK